MYKKVRAKMVCVSKKEVSDGIEIQLQPVTTGSHENESFFKYTPWGEVKLGVLNPEASDVFVEGKEYYLDFVQAGE